MAMLMEPVAPWLRELNRLVTSESAAFVPPADVLVTSEGVTVHMDVPGLRADQLEVDLENDILAVRGERPFPYRDDEAEWRRIERGFGRFERSLRVPRGLDPEQVQAALHDGVLTLRIPRPESLKPRRIQIQEEAGEQRDLQAGAQSGAQGGMQEAGAQEAGARGGMQGAGAQGGMQPGQPQSAEGAPS